MKHLSRNDIEAIAEKYVKAYLELPEIKSAQVYRIEPEIMLEKVLGLNVEYMHLSYDGSILGMTSFGNWECRCLKMTMKKHFLLRWKDSSCRI